MPINCPSCAREMPAASQYCSACGSRMAVEKTPVNLVETVAMPAGSMASKSSQAPTDLSLTECFDEGRFFPGTLVADRYRILGLIGRGGMGEVYRAHDLKLAQHVALKFLPQETAADETALSRFYNEVRVARQVSHPNVCRVFDIGEANGQPYISMEYVDGEDLGALLRRIGRLPTEKALEMARKLCAGLAAAHDKGVLHRDLKPANIMIDARGQVLIMDFGLAGVASQMHGAELRHGTPAYMAPEQLTGQEVSIRSDVYALGLVLYEIFTGRRAFEASSLAELIRVRENNTPTTLRSLVREVDPDIERVILRCLDADPENRPPSALAIAAALPGGDPLAAALAAGETPSPEMVAQAKAAGGLRPMVALACLVFIAVGLVGYSLLSTVTTWVAGTPVENSPDTLAHRAADIVERFGYPSKTIDKAFGLQYDFEYSRYLESKKPAPKDFASLPPGQTSPIRFWYRTSPQYLLAEKFGNGGEVTKDDPAPLLSGMIRMELDTRGRLLYFEAIPSQVDDPTGPAAAADWSQLFAAAGLEMARFKEAGPKWLPLTNTDTRKAWTGSFDAGSLGSLRVEAGSWRGKPVYFQLIQPWTRPERLTPFNATTAQNAARLILVIFLSTILVGACVLARRNVRLGRGDQRGAARLSTVLFLLVLGNWILTAHHTPTNAELRVISMGISQSLFLGALIWLLYIALEPYVRRRWPQTIISWSRILDGRFSDTLVGNRILTGIAAGVAVALLVSGMTWLEMQAGSPPRESVGLETLMGVPRIVSYLFGALPISISNALLLYFVFFLLRLVCRKEWLAGILFIAIFSAVAILQGSFHSFPAIGFRVLQYSLLVVVMMRFGLLALVVTITVSELLSYFPITTDFSAWYAGSGLFALALVAGLAAYAFHTALGGRSLLKDDLL